MAIQRNGTLFFSADDGINGVELWKSDGTAAGTVMVKDIFSGASSSDPYGMIAIGNILYFSADDGVSGLELWALDISNTLPVTLVSFNAKSSTIGSILTWSTSAESQNSHFILEKSLDGRTFSALDRIEGKGQASAYSFTDWNFRESSYYRLTQVDLDGAITVYDKLVRFVRALENEVTTYPNPVIEKLFVDAGLLQMGSEVKLIDHQGKLLKSKKVNDGMVVFEMEDLSSGIYLLQYKVKNKVKTEKIIKR